MNHENHGETIRQASEGQGPIVDEIQSITKSSRSASPPAREHNSEEASSVTGEEAILAAVVDSTNHPNNETPLQANTTLVDAVTDKIRGESMSLPPDSPNKNPQSSGLKSSNSHSGSDGDSSDKEHSRKRKLSSRSSTANEAAVRLHSKRPKESDVPEREEDFEESPIIVTQTSVNKPTQVFGFGSFASAQSPFAANQKDASVPALGLAQGSKAHPPADSERSKAAPEVPSPSVALVNAQSASLSLQSASGGFTAFASDSPFKRSSVTMPSSSSAATEQRESLAGPVRRSKSPVGKHQAFGQYSTGISRFGNLAGRKTQEESSGQQSTDALAGSGETVEFEDMLKSKGGEVVNDAIVKPEIVEVAHNTGEEDDLTIFQTRAKLYTQDETFAYKERGTGLLKVNVRRSDGEGARIVMRAEGVLRLILNMSLYPGLICELGPDPKFIKVAEITTRERRLHAIKVGNAKLAQELYDHLMENTPNDKHRLTKQPSA